MVCDHFIFKSLFSLSDNLFYEIIHFYGYIQMNFNLHRLKHENILNQQMYYLNT